MFAGGRAIYKRELKAYLHSTSTYVALGILFFATGYWYDLLMRQFAVDSEMAAAGGPFGRPDQAPNVNIAIIENVFNTMVWMLWMAVPVLSMRLFAAERSSGTIETLVTCPVDDWGVLLGKYFALVTMGVFIVALSAVYPLTTQWLAVKNGVSVDFNIVATCLVGLLLIFAGFSAFGVMASSFTSSQVTAAIVTLFGLLLWSAVGESPYFRPIAEEISAVNHTYNFTSGLLSLKDVVYFVVASFFFLFLAARALEARRWRI
jgi:ABC-2 type transport system permease protein